MLRNGGQSKLVTLRDLWGRPYKFYRGGSCEDISVGRFFCSCFDLANSYRLFDDSPVFEAEIAVKNPLIIDASELKGCTSNDRLHVYNGTIYPIEKKYELLRYAQKCFNKDTLSADEVLCWAKGIGDIDAVIIKNVREGNNSKLPVYDVMIWNKENLHKLRNVVNEQYAFEKFRENTFKRVDLSRYILENENDGIINISYGAGYVIEHTICRDDTMWYMGHEMVICTDVPVEIYCVEIRGSITAELLEPGIYAGAHGTLGRKQFVPHNGTVRIKDIMQNCEYAIK